MFLKCLVLKKERKNLLNNQNKKIFWKLEFHLELLKIVQVLVFKCRKTYFCRMTETRFVSGYQVDNPFRKYKVNFTIKHILFIVYYYSASYMTIIAFIVQYSFEFDLFEDVALQITDVDAC